MGDELYEIPSDLLEHASDEELEAYLEYLRLEHLELDRQWVLQPRQQAAETLARSGDVFELLYGGAAAGGKSEWILYHMYHLATEYPRFNGLILRRTFPELRRSLIVRSWARYDRAHARYYASEHIWRFENGSAIEFGYLESDQDVYQYQSAEYDAIAFDELTQFPTDFPYTYLMSRCRTTVDKRARGLNPHIIACTNPGGVGGSWVKERFVDIGPPNAVYPIRFIIDGEPRTVSRAFVPARRSDNAYIGEEYALALANLPEAIRAALEDGSWDHVEGQYFTEWSRETHVVDPFSIPPHWRRIRGVDYGYTNPMCCLWAAFDNDGNCYIYRELYQRELLPRQQASAINSMSVAQGRPEQIDYTVADPSIWARTGAGPPIAQQYVEAGLATRKANNARIDGWARVREFLHVNPRTHKPRLFVFNTCRNLIRTMPMQVHDDTKPEDLDTRGEDHACLVASTEVLTPRGVRRIDELAVGDTIAAPGKWVNVVAVGMTRRNAEVVEVMTTDCRNVTLTPDHRVLTDDGWVAARDLGVALRMHCATLFPWDGESSLFRTRSRRTAGFGTTAAEGTFSTRGSGFIVSSGPITAGQSPRASTFTIATATGVTTVSPTSNSLRRAHTSLLTRASELRHASLRLSARSRHSWRAMVVSRWMTGLLRLARAGSPLFGMRWRARNAVASWTPLSRAARNTAAAPVRPVPCAAAVAVLDAGRADVWDVQVDSDDHAFYVNGGIVVHNCDALRYLLMSRPLTTRDPRPAGTPDERHWENVKKRRSRNTLSDTPVGNLTG